MAHPERFLVLALCSFALAGCTTLAALIPPKIPAPVPPGETVWLSQNWTDEERFWFHHSSQGSATLKMPYSWFVALEQPHLKLFGAPGLLRDPDYMARFGFIRSPKALSQETAQQLGYPAGRKYAYTAKRTVADWSVTNEHELPVGVVRLRAPKNPVTGEPMSDRIGFSCATCHTGQLEYGGTRLLIDGGSSVIDLGKFRDTMGLALVYTNLVPGRFGRFAERVLGSDASKEDREKLKQQVESAVAGGRKDREIQAEILASRPDVVATVEEGFSRLDALTRIGNTVFYEQQRSPNLDERDPDVETNLAPIIAPVNPPPTFYTSWFNWVQYDGSIMQPMIRNAGEALGVSALVNLRQEGEHLYRSSVALKKIYELEQLLAGPPPFEDPGPGGPSFRGLKAPKWREDILGPIDPARHAKGAVLYAELCQGCHLPPVSSPEFWDTASPGSHWTAPKAQGRRYLKLKEIDVGTDPGQASVLGGREIYTPAFLGVNPGRLNLGDDHTRCQPSGFPDQVVTRTAFAWALGAIAEKTVTKIYDDQNLPGADRERLNGYRPNCLKATPTYKARPLEGIWATAPFLHNGSVPNLYELLQSKETRSKEPFYLGRWTFDPVKVGYVHETEPFEGSFELDPTIPGNLNTGHYFGDGAFRDGFVRPRELSEEERWSIIEYLKHMDDLATLER